MLNNFATVNFRSYQSTALLTLAILIGGLVNPFVSAIEAKPRYQRLFSTDRLGIDAPNHSYGRLDDYHSSQQFNANPLAVPAETLIPVALKQGQSFTVKKGENQALTLRTTSPLRQANGRIVVPAGSEIVGQFRPVANGSGVRFVAQQLILRDGQFVPINAQSRELVGFEQRNRGASASDVITGTLAGAGTATIIAGTTGDRRINALEVLGGAAAGALAGWGLPTAGIIGGGTEDVMTVSGRDLTLMLQSPLYLEANQQEDAYQDNPLRRPWSSASW